jgi:hypothetical protein
MLKQLRFLTTIPGTMPRWAKEEEERILRSINRNNRTKAEAIRIAAEEDEEVMRERHRNPTG